MAQARQGVSSGGEQDWAEAYEPSASGWPLVAVVAAVIALPGLVHGLPREVQVGLILLASHLGMLAILGWIRDDLRASPRAARWRLVTARADSPTPYSPPVPHRRSEMDTALHLRALQRIARLRFDFPTEEHRDFKTYLNQPRRTMGVRMPGGFVAYPDIVVVQSPENNTKIVAQVETAETVSEDTAFYVWGPYAELAPLYVYVPVGAGDEALALCRRLDIPVVGIRTWRFIVGYDEIEINDHYTV